MFGNIFQPKSQVGGVSINLDESLQELDKVEDQYRAQSHAPLLMASEDEKQLLL
jgi:hypothetical protein